jgi:hypothetical protein
MVNSKSNGSYRATFEQTMLPLLFVAGAAALQLFNPQGSCAVCQSFDDSIVELTRAREQANSTAKVYETVKRLSERGSVSQQVLRRSDMQRKVALLNYSSLLDPNRREKNLVLKTEVILHFRIKELAVIKQLYGRGSASKVDYLRSVAAKDIAAANFKAAQSASHTQRKFQAIMVAKSKLEIAQQEYEIAIRQFQSQAISRSALELATSNLRIATAELETRKQSLGARAVEVKQ